jgi:signal transduction histidine kinase
MTIRTRLTLMFAAIMAVILGAALFFVYGLQSRLVRDEFYGLLSERAATIATIFLERDSTARLRMIEFEQRNVRTLPAERILVVGTNGEQLFAMGPRSLPIPFELIAKARSAGHAQRSLDGRQAIAHSYRNNIVVVVSASDMIGSEQLDELRWIMLSAFLVSLAATFAGGVFFAGRALEPMNRVVRRVGDISASNLHLRVDIGDGRDEIARLSMTFNEMLERLEKSFETQRTFVTNASHELRTPLTAIIGEIHVQLARERTAPEYRASLLSVLNEAERLNAIVSSLLMLAQYEEGRMPLNPEEVRLDDVVVDAIGMIQHHPGSERIQVQIDSVDDGQRFAVLAHRSLLLVCITNLIDNALKYSSADIVEVSVRASAERVSVSIRDRGIGIPANVLHRLTEPFFRAHNARGIPGFGIGLAVTQRIVSLYKGTLDVVSDPTSGTTATLSLPSKHSPL